VLYALVCDSSSNINATVTVAAAQLFNSPQADTTPQQRKFVLCHSNSYEYNLTLIYQQ
jgi:hypothetical protein